ncbi:MAG: hypothetical protein HY093_01230 [Candidatus Liptonbacteria bacterium]|nr:hypothetical protein [Candidatus Liptonbacteria bacterium]
MYEQLVYWIWFAINIALLVLLFVDTIKLAIKGIRFLPIFGLFITIVLGILGILSIPGNPAGLAIASLIFYWPIRAYAIHSKKKKLQN